ncbi:MAG: DUF4440 domain-containing protein [Gemmatimonadota bacterium]
MRTCPPREPLVSYRARVFRGVVFVAMAVGGCSGPDDTATTRAREEIREVTRRWEAALIAGDPEGAVSAVFTEDALRLPAGEPVVRGRAAIADALAGSAALAEARFDLEDIEVDGELAYAAGTYSVRAPEGDPLTGKFLEVWKRTRDGWRIHRVMWD